MLDLLATELERVRRELLRLSAQAEMLERLLCHNEDAAASGLELPVVEVREAPAIPAVPPDAGQPVSKERPMEIGQACKRWELYEDILIAQSGCETFVDFSFYRRLSHRTTGSLYQRYRYLARKGRLAGLKTCDPNDPVEPPPAPAEHQPPTRVLKAGERKEVVLPTARKKDLSFEEQLERVRRGEVGIIEVQPVRAPPPDRTLGGIGTGML